MKMLALLSLLLLLPACWPIGKPRVWEIDELAQRGGTLVALWDHDYKSMYVKKQTVLRLQAAHERIAGGAELGTRLVIVPAEDPNAFAGLMEGKRVIGITTGMIRFVGEDMDQYAAVLCHLAAHWLKGHIEWNSVRRGGLGIMGIAINLVTVMYLRQSRRLEL
jgi:Zn-dependent protease with chaperone function